MMAPELRQHQIRIPRKILGRNSGLTFVIAQKLKNRFFRHVTFLGVTLSSITHRPHDHTDLSVPILSIPSHVHLTFPCYSTVLGILRDIWSV